MQMLLSTVSAGIVVPLVWYAPSGLAIAMLVYVLIGLFVITRTQLWQAKA